MGGVETTDRVPPMPGEGLNSALVFKIVTVVLVVAALGLGGLYVYQQSGKGQGPSIDPRHDVPTPNGTKVKPTRPTGPLYAIEVSIEKRDLVLANQFESDGDNAWQLNRMDEAKDRYLDAWVLAPSAALALKLGEICFQRDETGEAREWWTRHLKESSNSRAAIYINSVLPKSE
jgi:serine/threonine-protein kinase